MKKEYQIQLRVEKIYKSLENLLIEQEKEINLQSIKQAYRELARKYHPDVNDSLDAKKLFLLIQKSYEHLIEELEYIENNLELINKYQDFIKDNREVTEENPIEKRKKEIERLKLIKPSTKKELEMKIFNWLEKEKKWLEEDYLLWNEYVLILKDETNTIASSLQEEINKLTDLLETSKKDQNYYKNELNLKKQTKTEFVDEVRKQIKFKNKELETRSKKLKELSFVCRDLNSTNNSLFNNLLDYYYFETEFLKNKRQDSGIDIIDKLLTKNNGR